ncbi:MAG: hypothetical protein JXA90_12875 [Planctomycetes bacterium]|nr:hypothetical protein [Planctomycetota bacterium]
MSTVDLEMLNLRGRSRRACPGKGYAQSFCPTSHRRGKDRSTLEDDSPDGDR